MAENKKPETSIWKKIAGTLVEFDETVEKVEDKKPVTTTPVVIPQTYTPPAQTNYNGVPSEIEDTFKNILKEKNMPGVDYYEFIVMKSAMAAIPIENVKYASAFAGLQVQGLTKETLLSSAEKYKEIIQAEVADFQAAFAQEFKLSVEDKKSLIEQKSNEMAELSKKIAAINEEIRVISDEVIANEQKLLSAKTKFENGGHNAIMEIDKEINNIKNFIN